MPTTPQTPPQEEPIEVEAERLEAGGESERRRPGGAAGAGFGPILAGLLLDAADFITPFSLPGPLALLVGAGAGWYVGGYLGLHPKQRLVLAAVGAVYCTIPNTSRLPLGTVVGVLMKLGALGRR